MKNMFVSINKLIDLRSYKKIIIYSLINIFCIIVIASCYLNNNLFDLIFI